MDQGNGNHNQNYQQYYNNPAYWSNDPNGPYYPGGWQRVSEKSRTIALLLCIFLGGLGIHRFYVNKIGTGILWLLTGGCFGIGCLVDLILIICGSFTDQSGAVVKRWDN